MPVVQIKQRNGLIIDLATAAASFVDVVYAGTSAGSVAYPHLAGFTLLISASRIDGTQWAGMTTASVDYSNGYPIISWSAGTSPTQFIVLAR